MAEPLPEPTVKWVLLSWRGRLSRQSYFLGAMLLLVVQVYILINLVQTDRGDENQMAAWGFVLIGFWLLAAWALLAMTIKRLNDLNLPALAAIGLFFPLVSMLFVILLMALPGFDQTNEHGPPPFPKK